MVENQQKLESEKTRVYAQKPRLKMPFKKSIKKTGISDHDRLSFYRQSVAHYHTCIIQKICLHETRGREYR